MRRPPIALPVFACLCLLACGGADGYAADHEDELRNDCQQTVDCLRSQDVTVSADPVNQCIAASGSRLNQYSASKRAAWEKGVAKCMSLRQCQYYDCTQMEDRYSDLHAADIRYDCAARIACNTTRGIIAESTAVEQCVMRISAALDVQTPESRAAGFETRFARCKQLQQCAYADCP